MTKSKIITLVIIVAVVLVGGTMFYLGNQKTPTNQITTTNNEIKDEVKIPEILGNKGDLLSFSVIAGGTIANGMKVSGIVKNGYFFEANILVNVLDANKTLLKSGHGTAITDWMTVGPVSFESNLDLSGLTPGAGFIEIHNDNASGLPANDKSILIPVIIN
jgi:hypothetical protein